MPLRAASGPVFAYAVYCLVVAVAMLAIFMRGIPLILDPTPLTKEFVFLDVPMSLEPWRARLMAGVVAIPALGLAVLNAWLPFYRGRNAWPIHLINVLLGAGSCVFTPLCLPLLFFWFRPDVKRHYGYPASPR